jgi:hypothetical protein
LFIYCRHGAGKSRGQYRADERAANGVIGTNSNRPHQRERLGKQTVRQLTDDALRSSYRTVITSQKVMLSDCVDTAPSDVLYDASPFIPELLCNRRNPAWLESLGSTMVDFKKQLGGKESFAKLTDPIEIYETLDRASDNGPLRPAQKAISD